MPCRILTGRENVLSFPEGRLPVEGSTNSQPSDKLGWLFHVSFNENNENEKNPIVVVWS